MGTQEGRLSSKDLKKIVASFYAIKQCSVCHALTIQQYVPSMPAFGSQSVKMIDSNKIG